MEQQGRSFNCNRCDCLVIIPRANDRGNIYCANRIVPTRRESLRAARKRYQNTNKGKSKNAEHQHKHRQRKIK